MHINRSTHADFWRRLAAVALVASALPVRAEIVEIVFGSDRQFTHAFEVPPGKFAEACGRVAKGSAVAWRFSSGEPVDFNIHYHEGRKAIYPAKLDSTGSAQGTLAASVDEPYCWMWTNKSSRPAKVSVQISQ